MVGIGSNYARFFYFIKYQTRGAGAIARGICLTHGLHRFNLWPESVPAAQEKLRNQAEYSV